MKDRITIPPKLRHDRRRQWFIRIALCGRNLGAMRGTIDSTTGRIDFNGQKKNPCETKQGLSQTT
ncbi:MAG: hypothetical protein H0U86_08100 [Chloroflexi bacterium]|nr:hypothetical protein [Chloroflexota bacterium]